MPFIRNKSQRVTVLATDPFGNRVTGEANNITCKISKEGSTGVATDDVNPSQMDSGSQPGLYDFVITATEFDATKITLTPVCSTTGVTLEPVSIHTIDGSGIYGGYVWLDNIFGGTSTTLYVNGLKKAGLQSSTIAAASTLALGLPVKGIRMMRTHNEGASMSGQTLYGDQNRWSMSGGGFTNCVLHETYFDIDAGNTIGVLDTAAFNCRFAGGGTVSCTADQFESTRFDTCVFQDITIKKNETAGALDFINCVFDGVTLDMASLANNVTTVEASGTLTIINLTEADSLVTLIGDVDVIVDASCTDGDVVLIGQGKVTDGAGGTAINEDAFNPGGTGGDSAQDIYDLFTTGSNEDAFKATGFATPTNVSDGTAAVISAGASWVTADVSALLLTTAFNTKLPNILNTTAAGNIGIDWANVENKTATVALTNTQVNANAVSATAAFVEDMFTVDSTLVSGSEVEGSLILEIAKVVCDRVLTGATHNIPTSLGRIIRSLSGLIFEDGTAQGGGDNEITLAAGAVTYNGQFEKARIVLTDGPGAGQENIITESTTSDDKLIVADTWRGTNPTATTAYEITPGQVHASVRNGGYDNQTVYFKTGGQAGTQKGVNGTTTRPSGVEADTYSIMTVENLPTIKLSPGSVFNLPSDSSNKLFTGSLYTVTLNGKVITNTQFTGALAITGTATSATFSVFDFCGLGALNVSPIACSNCGFFGDVTFSSAGDSTIGDSAPLAGITPNFILPNTATKSRLSFPDWTGCLFVKNMGLGGSSDDLVEISGSSRLILDSSCTDGTVDVYAPATLDLNGATGITVNYYTILDDPIGLHTASGSFGALFNAIPGAHLAISDQTDNLPSDPTSETQALVNMNAILSEGGSSWLTATGFSTHNAADVYAAFTAGTNEDVFKADVSALATATNVSDGTAEIILQGSDGPWTQGNTTTPPTPVEIYAHFTLGLNEDAFKADTSGLATATNVSDGTAAVISEGGSSWITADTSGLATELNATANANAILAEGGSSWITASGFNTVVPDNAGIAAIKLQSDKLVFSGSNLLVDLRAWAGLDLTAGANMVIDTGGNKQFSAHALDKAPSGTGGDASAANQITIIAQNQLILDTGDDGPWTSGSGGSGGGGGDGSESVQLVFKDADTLQPVADAKIWIDTSNQNQNKVAGTQHTNDQGEVTFLLNPGNYWAFADKSLARFSPNPFPFTVVAS